MSDLTREIVEYATAEQVAHLWLVSDSGIDLDVGLPLHEVLNAFAAHGWRLAAVFENTLIFERPRCPKT